MINPGNIQKQMKKGVLELCMLSVIKRQKSYPSEIIDALKEADMVILKGTLDPFLSRLKTAGILGYRWEESPSGPSILKQHLIITKSIFFKDVLFQKTYCKLKPGKGKRK